MPKLNCVNVKVITFLSLIFMMHHKQLFKIIKKYIAFIAMIFSLIRSRRQLHDAFPEGGLVIGNCYFFIHFPCIHLFSFMAKMLVYVKKFWNFVLVDFWYFVDNDEAHSSLYHLIAADITNINQMEDKLIKAGLNLR